MRLYLDIETLPAPPEMRETVLSTLKEQPLDEEGRKLALEETSFRAEFGRVLCIGYLKEPGMSEPDVLCGDEPAMLRRFWELARGARLFVGHNIFEFDLPFLIRRSIIHRVKPHPIAFIRYRNQPIYDTMQEWAQWTWRGRVGLDTLAKAMGLRSSKAAMDGSQVAEYHAQGRDAEIYAYCKDDVRVTREIYRRMTFSE